jgi:dihydroxy-acid dehydratase
MSGTAYGTVVLHVSPEAARGGPLAVVRTGDMIELDVANRRLHLEVSDAELAARLAAWESPVERPSGGYAQLYHDHVQGPETGADLDFLVGPRGNAVAREAH